MDRLRLARHGKRGETGFRIFGGFRLDGPEAFGQRGGDFFGVARRPDAGAVNTPAAAVQVNAIHHDIDVLVPLIDHVVTEQEFAKAWAVDLHARIAFVALDCLSAAENFDPPNFADDFGAHLAAAGINADAFAGHTSLEERGVHTIWRPWLLRAGL